MSCSMRASELASSLRGGVELGEGDGDFVLEGAAGLLPAADRISCAREPEDLPVMPGPAMPAHLGPGEELGGGHQRALSRAIRGPCSASRATHRAVRRSLTLRRVRRFRERLRRRAAETGRGRISPAMPRT